MFYHVDLPTVTFDLRLGVGLAFFVTPACKLPFDAAAMDSNNTNFNEFTMPLPAAVGYRKPDRSRRAKIPLSSRGEQRRPAVGTLRERGA
jgi:hypothetical protein